MEKFLIKLIKWESKVLLRNVKRLDDCARLLKQENEQWFLNYQDELNHMSIL